MSVLPPDFAWHQSSVGTMLRCPEQFRLQHVAQVPADYAARNFAAPLGTADHAGMEHVLHACNAGEAVEREALIDVVVEAFEEAIAKNQERGATYDPEGVERALERLEGARLERLLLMAEDPRLRAIHWLGIEWGFDFRERGGRRWKGTLDAWGVAIRDVEDFGTLGRDPTNLRAGEGVLADWKTGELPPFGFVSRVRSPQLGIYLMALVQAIRSGVAEDPGVSRWRTFLGSIQDVERPKAPTDESGKRIPKNLPEQINPDWAEAAGLSLEEAAAFKGRPKGIPRGVAKWLPKQPNPVFERAIRQPKGPVFHEAVVDCGRVLDTARQAIRAAELGLFPAAGAVTGACSICPYAGVCASTTTDTDHPEETSTHDR